MIDLRVVNREQFGKAKVYWALAHGLKVLIFMIGAAAIFANCSRSYTPTVLLLLAISAEFCQLRSDGVKSRAESLLRSLDFCRSFGGTVSEADVRDLLVSVPKVSGTTMGKSVADRYFESTEVPGPRGAVQNLIESAWYTRHLASAMATFYGVSITLLVIVSLSALVVAARSIGDEVLRDQVVRAVIAWMMLIVSLNMIKGVVSYFKMSQRCQRIEVVCGHLLKGNISETEALKQWYEYQLARSSSPLLPDWLWEVKMPKLRGAWEIGRGRDDV
jgi:hypothetical protein